MPRNDWASQPIHFENDCRVTDIHERNPHADAGGTQPPPFMSVRASATRCGSVPEPVWPTQPLVDRPRPASAQVLPLHAAQVRHSAVPAHRASSPYRGTLRTCSRELGR